jgi:hypothetical protein
MKSDNPTAIGSSNEIDSFRIERRAQSGKGQLPFSSTSPQSGANVLKLFTAAIPYSIQHGVL